jgi:predicted  nucleic acid-binding Zn-ribbon protein
MTPPIPTVCTCCGQNAFARMPDEEATICDACREILREPQGSPMQLFVPAPTQLPGQTAMGLQESAKDRECPTCHARPGSPCRRPSGHNVFGGGFHSRR